MPRCAGKHPVSVMQPSFPCQTYFITNGAATPETFIRDKGSILTLVQKAVDAGVSMVQLREKALTAKQLFELTQDAAKITETSSTKLLVNDRADIASTARADGVHLTSTSFSAEIIRRNFPGLLIGVSAHTPETAFAAKHGGADLITFSPIFPTKSKINYGPPQGVEKLNQLIEALDGFPVFALGGIDRENYLEILASRAAGIAGISLFYEMLEGDAKL
jgi:thiamine-phosphate pyrophosphorylase